MSENQQQSRRGGDKRNFRKPVRPGGGSDQPQKQYKRVVSAAKTNGADDTASSPSLIKFDGQGSELSEEPKTSPLATDTPPESPAAVDVPRSNAPHIRTDPHHEDSYPKSASGVSDQTAPNGSPVRDGTSKDVSLRFGSFAPDLVNGMKIPPRTSSAPPNSDEHRWKQGTYTAFRPKNIVLPSSFSSGLQPRVDIKQSMNDISPQTHSQGDVHSHLQGLVVTGTRSSSLASSGVPMTIPHPQSHIPAQYGIPSPQIQSPGIPPTSPQMPMPLPVGSPCQVRHPTFVPGLPPHLPPHLPPQPHGSMHQPQGFNYFPQIGHQLSPQPGSSVGVSPRFPQQHIRNLSPRTVVKITHPNTNEELKLDERADSSPGGYHNMGFPLHPVAYSHSHPLSYFPHVHRAPVILQSPPSIPPAISSGPSNLQFSSPGMYGMTVSSEHSGTLTPNNPASNTASSVAPPQKSANSITPLSSICFNRAPTDEGAFVMTDDKKLSAQKTESEKWKMTSMKDTQVEPAVSDWKAGQNTSGSANSETIEGQGVTTSPRVCEGNEFEARMSKNVSSTEKSDVESSKIGFSLSGSGLPDDGEFSPSTSSGKNSVNSQSNTKPTIYRVKSATTKGKKKRKELLQKEDPVGSTSDVSMAFKGVHKTSESTVSSESTENFSQKGSSTFSEMDITVEDDPSKLEPDDWDTAAELSSPKIINFQKTAVSQHGIAPMGKKYSRDFLLSLSQKFTKIPPNFRITYDFREALLDPNAIMPIDVSHNTISGWEKITENSGALRPGSHGNGFTDDGRRNKSAKSFSSGFEPRIDVSHRGNAFGFRSGQGGTHGVFKSPRGQASGLPHLVSPGGTQRNGAGVERWQHASGVQKVTSPVQVMHKAKKKYEIQKVSDAEEAKHRQLKAILNKLTPQNFERLFEQVKEVNIDNAGTLSGVIAQIFDKALMEPTFCEMYATFCYHLAGELPDFIENDQKITFKRLLLNKCQEEFERGEREQAEADQDEGEGQGEIKQSEEEREAKRICARRRILGNIRLIGELYKKKMLTERIMHECIQKLLGQHQNPDEEDIESLCKLMSTIGEMIDHPKAREYMDAYFEIMTNLSNNMNFSSRVRFMLKDVIDLRENKWQQRRKVEGPKKIEELHRDAAQERQASRMTRGSSFTSSRRGQPADFGHRRPPMFSPTNQQMGSVRGLPPPVRGFGNQDVRSEDRALPDNRILPVPLSPRPMDTQVSLGPKGGIGKGLSVRGPPMLSVPPRMDLHSNFGEFRGSPGSMNGYYSMPNSPNQEAMQRFQENLTRPSISGQPHRQGHVHPLNSELMNPRHSPGRSVTGHLQRPTISNILPGKDHSEEHLNKMSMAAIKEFYSARDENELIMCVKDLDAPSFYPAMISLWVNDSFERNNGERDLLSILLVNLTKSREGTLNINQLSDGFQLVLANLEDAVTDAPKAAVYLGGMFGRIVLENVMSLREIGRLLQQGGEKPGQLIQNGLGYQVFENTLEVIKLEKGESSLEEICKSSNVQLEEFRPPGAQVNHI